MFKCAACDGLGDLDAFRLRAAYLQGAEDATRHLRAVASTADLAVKFIERGPSPDLEYLKARLTP